MSRETVLDGFTIGEGYLEWQKRQLVEAPAKDRSLP